MPALIFLVTFGFFFLGLLVLSPKPQNPDYLNFIKHKYILNFNTNEYGRCNFQQQSCEIILQGIQPTAMEQSSQGHLHDRYLNINDAERETTELWFLIT